MAAVDNCMKLVVILLVFRFKLSRGVITQVEETTMIVHGDPTQLLRNISDLTEDSPGLACTSDQTVVVVPVPIDARFFADLSSKIDLIGDVIVDGINKAGSREFQLNEWVSSVVCQALRGSETAKEVRIQVTKDGLGMSSFGRTCAHHPAPHRGSTGQIQFPKRCGRPLTCTTATSQENISDRWFRLTSEETWNETLFQMTPESSNESSAASLARKGHWTYPYFHCNTERWIMSYVKPFGVVQPTLPSSNDYKNNKSPPARLGHLTVDVDLSALDLNQCDADVVDADAEGLRHPEAVVRFFENTHKCHRDSTFCAFRPHHGWRQGGYACVCNDGFYSPKNETFQGAFVEVAWLNKHEQNILSYDGRYQCTQCHEACPNCTDASPCMSEYNKPFRITLLAISMICILFTIILMVLVFYYRNVKVFKVASPAFLEICLLGCIIMYLEMASIFPLLDMTSCIFTKWFRHMGFCITFSSLVMKTWRVSLNYRVKSAHKIKLTDKQLLQWMTPILLIMIIYLSLWTVSEPPDWEYIEQESGLSFIQCKYQWWDHSLAFGELLFLLWGVKVCYGVRKAESFFDEAKCISWAVYNITLVNIIMASFHVYFFPTVGPDMKYFFGFIRTQFSTTVTIGFVFVPKLLRVLKGTGNQLDNKMSERKGVAATFSVNGISGNTPVDTLPDPIEENEELKEEIQKLAAQIEFMKIVHMEVNNRHLKPKPGGYFSDKSPSSLQGASGGPSAAAHKISVAKMEINETTAFGPAADSSHAKDTV